MLFCFKHANIILAFSIVHGPHAVVDSFSSAGIPWGTPSQVVLLVEWLWNMVRATYVCTHTYARINTCTQEQSGTYLGMDWFRKATIKGLQMNHSLLAHSLFLFLSHFLNLKLSTLGSRKALICYATCSQNTDASLDFDGMVTAPLKRLWILFL